MPMPSVPRSDVSVLCLQGVHHQKQNMVFFGAAGIAGRARLHAIVSRSVTPDLVSAVVRGVITSVKVEML